MDKIKIGAAALVILAMLGFLAFLVTRPAADPVLLATLVAALTAGITALIQVIRGGGADPTKPEDPKGPPSNMVALALAIGTILSAGGTIGCSSSSAKRAEAAGAYANEVARCDDAAPKLAPDAGMDERRAAWASFDACMERVHAKWSITVTTTGKDGGR